MLVDPSPECFEIRALQAGNEWPPGSPNVELSGRVATIESARAAAPMVAVHVEFYRPDICWEGRILNVDDKEVHLLEVSTEGVWLRKPRVIDTEDVTRLDFGGDYERALALVAGEPPAP